MSAVVDIGALRFEGYSPGEAGRAARSFERELEALLKRHGLPPGVRSRDIGDVQLDELPADALTPEGLGAALARALFRRLTR